jgi:competence protein ComEC
MRKLVWLAVGLCGGCALVAYLYDSEILLPAAAVAALFTLIFACLKFRKTALVFMGFLIGVLYSAGYSQHYFACAKEYDGTEQILSITVTDYSEITDYGIRCEGEISLSGRKYQVLFYGYEEMELKPGDCLNGEFLLRLTSPGGSKESTYHQGSGLYFIAYCRGELTHTLGNEQDFRYFPQRLRQTILRKMEAIFPESTAGFAKALLLGDTSGLTYMQDVAFQTSGVRHIVAVSGLHVSILFALIYTLSGKMPFTAALFGIPMLILFACVAGLSPSIVRACIMQSVMILALLFRREYDPPSALATAVIVILFANPFSVVSVSFQLSCGCIVGIFLFSARLQRYIYSKVKGFTFKAKALRAIGSAVSVTVGTMIVTTPLCALYFGSISLVGVLTNLLTLWAVSIIFYGIVFSCVLSFLWLPLGKIVAAVISVLMHYVLLMAEWLSKLPLAAVYTASPYIVLWLVFCYVLFAIFWVGGRKHIGLTTAIMAVLLIFASVFSWVEPRIENYRMTVLDVGQGQCIILQSRGETYLVDCGGSGDKTAANTAANQLLSQGIDHVDGIILTHYDRDHIGGLSYLLQQIKADILYLPAGAAPPGWLPPGQKTETLSDIRKIALGVATLTLIPGAEPEDENENSTCVLFQAKECAILITGDRGVSGEAQLLQQIKLPKLTYLIAGHHGADTSTSASLLEKTMPETVLISVGKNNFYGHPQQATLWRLNIFGCRVLRTDENGTIIIRG